MNYTDIDLLKKTDSVEVYYRLALSFLYVFVYIVGK
jgi:hypothetical protein